MPDVIVVGAGPVGTLLAAELSRLGVSVVLLEQRGAPGEGTRAIGVHSPVLAALEASGVTERLLASAVRVTRGAWRPTASWGPPGASPFDERRGGGRGASGGGGDGARTGG